ncbi:MAG: tetratricopeptide repeat protein [bacterium]|nr:tetratricopeptide repeat protein [bacterium]
MSKISNASRFGFVAVILTLLAACSENEAVVQFSSIAEPATGSNNLKKAQVQFLSGNFGLAERHYKTAIEEAPDDVDGWLGLAASYDKLRRFDLADKAYGRVRQLVGDTPEVLNNIGYSYMLRGELEKAREHINTAFEHDPDNPTIRQNVERLNRKIAKKAG